MHWSLNASVSFGRSWSLRYAKTLPVCWVMLTGPWNWTRTTHKQCSSPTPPTELSGGLVYVRPTIRLEMGARSDDWPAADAEITPYAAEVMPDLFSVRTCNVRTLSAERTFWEKATLLHAECHRPTDKPSRERLSRHYYDLYRLSLQPVSERALQQRELLERVIAHKSFFFAQSWANYDTARPGTFRLLPVADHLDALRRDYQAMEAMIFGHAPAWPDIVRSLQELERRINALA